MRDAATSTPEKALQFLVALDPSFGVEWAADEPDAEDLNFHSITRAFAQHFGASHKGYSAKQLTSLGEWLNAAVASGGEIENAVGTCFLEHAHQLKVNRVLAPYLSREAKERTHA